MAKSNFEKALDYFAIGGCFVKGSDFESYTIQYGGYGYKFTSDGKKVLSESDLLIPCEMAVTATTTVGEICKFISEELFRSKNRLPAPGKLAGSGKDFEELMLSEAGRLENQKLLTMNRYGVMVVNIKGEWMPVPSLPDFEGVLSTGQQFITEAKVCTQPSFRIQKDKLKHKQVAHMLNRSRFNVKCFLTVHFNERLGSTFYDAPFTVAVPVKHSKDGGWEVWEQFAAEKDKKKEFPSLTRELAREIGIEIPWHIPPRCTTLRPDLSFLLS
jgi:penicillin-binding protein-related factor A (putative recombinase)